MATRNPRMLWDLTSLVLGQLFSMSLGFVAFAYLARTLSADSYGLVEYAVGLSVLGGVIIEGGLGAIGTRQVSRDRARAPALASRIPTARLLLAVLVIPVLAVVGLLTTSEAAGATMIGLFAFALLGVLFKQDWLLQGLERMTYVAPAQTLRSAAFLVGVLVLVRAQSSLVWVGAAESGAALLTALYFLTVQRVVLHIRGALDFRFSTAWELIRAGASVGASNILWPFMVYVPVLLVTNLAGSTEAAWLGAGQRIAVALVSFSGLYFFNLYPVIARGLQEDLERWRRLMGSSLRLIAWGSIGPALAITLFADPIIRLVFGPSFVSAAPVLSLAIWILPLRMLSGHARWTLLAAERQGVLLVVELLCAAVIVMLGVALIPSYGATGAATAAVAGNLVGWLLAHVGTARYVGRLPRMRHVLLPAGAAALAAAAIAWLLGNHPWLGSGLALLMYASCLGLAGRGLVDDAVRLAYSRTVANSGPGGAQVGRPRGL